MKPQNDNPGASEWAALNSHLARLGYKLSERRAMIGQTPQDYTRGQCSDRIKAKINGSSS